MMHYNNSTHRGGISPATERRSIIAKEGAARKLLRSSIGSLTSCAPA